LSCILYPERDNSRVSGERIESVVGSSQVSECFSLEGSEIGRYIRSSLLEFVLKFAKKVRDTCAELGRDECRIREPVSTNEKSLAGPVVIGFISKERPSVHVFAKTVNGFVGGGAGSSCLKG
jgi:hypothetical protein